MIQCSLKIKVAGNPQPSIRLSMGNPEEEGEDELWESARLRTLPKCGPQNWLSRTHRSS